jgi:hypothetical protein
MLSIFRWPVAVDSDAEPAAPASGPLLPPKRGSAVALPPSPTEPPSGPLLPPKGAALRATTSVQSGSADVRRLLIGFDATASREPTWKQASRLTDTLLKTLPGRLEVALAVHGGGRLHTVTRFTSDAERLRKRAARIYCEGGYTRMLDLLAHAAALAADVVLYIGDAFEESPSRARKVADRLGKRGTRVIVLQEGHDPNASDAFAEIAERTGGAVLPFDISSFDRIGKELLELVAVLAVEGVEAVEAIKDTTPAAQLLLSNLDPKRLLIGHTKG